MDVCTNMKWQTSVRLVLDLNVCTILYYQQNGGGGGGDDLHLDYPHLFCQLCLSRGHQVPGMATGMPGICGLLLSLPNPLVPVF